MSTQQENKGGQLSFILLMSLILCFFLAFAVGVQFLFGKHRSFWGLIGQKSQSGLVRLEKFESRKNRMRYWTVSLRGLKDAPSLSIQDQWSDDDLNLHKLAEVLKEHQLGKELKVEWVQPWSGAPLYLKMEGRDIRASDKLPRQLIWIFLSFFPLFLIAIVLLLLISNLRKGGSS